MACLPSWIMPGNRLGRAITLNFTRVFSMWVWEILMFLSECLVVLCCLFSDKCKTKIFELYYCWFYIVAVENLCLLYQISHGIAYNIFRVLNLNRQKKTEPSLDHLAVRVSVKTLFLWNAWKYQLK